MGGGDRGRLIRLALGEAGRALRGAAAASLRRVALIRAPTPTRVLIAPHDLRTSDPTAASDIYAGRFIFAGQAVQTGGGSPFTMPLPSAAWGAALYGFGWLRHLRAADTVLARQNARALIDEFLRVPPADRRLARTSSVLARRLISFLNGSPLILEGADHAFYQRYLRALGQIVRAIEVRLAAGLPPVDRLNALIALAYAGLCCEGLDPVLRRATRGLERELDTQILPDGGHASRNPRVLAELLLDLLPLRQTYAGRRLDPPGALIGAIDRALPMLRLFRGGDGSLAHHNGTGASAADHVATLLVYDAHGRALQHAPYAGYGRLEAGSTLLVADVGGPPPLPLSAEAHAGCLSFELWSGAHRIVVNCAAPPSPPPAVQAARHTAAHSTATLADSSSARFLSPDSVLRRWLLRRLGPVILEGPSVLVVTRDGTASIGAGHDGYRARLGLVHERRWRLLDDGARLLGEDLFRRDPGAGAAGAVVRFHLHPQVSTSRAGDAVVLTLVHGERWRFEAWGAAIALEESVFFAAPEGARRTEQITLNAGPGTEAVRWCFERLDGPAPTGQGDLFADHASGEGP